VDLRGTGETAPTAPAKKSGHFGGDFKEIFLALHLGRPLLGQRVLDLLSVVQGTTSPRHGIDLYAFGSAGPVALHAAALSPLVKSVTIEGSVLSWGEVVRTPLGVNQLTNVVPGALKLYDLPELAALTAPRPLAVVRPVDPTGAEVTQEALEKEYASGIAAYRHGGAARQLSLRAGR
jgi:hypothetical protein